MGNDPITRMIVKGTIVAATALDPPVDRKCWAFHLVNRVFPDDRLDEMTWEWAKEIAKTSKYAIYMSKQVFYSQIEMTEWQAYQYAKEMMAMAGVSTNSIEGFTAFLEKREPAWDESTPF